MARQSNANYSILVDVELQTESIKKQLNESVGKLKNETSKAAKATKELTLEWQQAQYIMNKSLDIIRSMVDEVYALDASVTEFSKVSELQGAALEKYVDDLAVLGKTVARTGKPLCLSRNVQMVNVH